MQVEFNIPPNTV